MNLAKKEGHPSAKSIYMSIITMKVGKDSAHPLTSPSTLNCPGPTFVVCACGGGRRLLASQESPELQLTVIIYPCLEKLVEEEEGKEKASVT